MLANGVYTLLCTLAAAAATGLTVQKNAVTHLYETRKLGPPQKCTTSYFSINYSTVRVMVTVGVRVSAVMLKDAEHAE